MSGEGLRRLSAGLAGRALPIYKDRMTSDPSEPEETPRPRERRSPSRPRPRPVTAEWLFRAGAFYLERYASSSQNLRRILERKIARRLADGAHEEPDPGTAAVHREMVEAAIAHFTELKLLDDTSFAEARFSSLRRRGASLRQAGARLAQKGVDRETIDRLATGDDTGDRRAAFVYARRRRLGPHRARDRTERRDRDIAAMMRAGFSFADARAAIDADLDGEDEAADPA